MSKPIPISTLYMEEPSVELKQKGGRFMPIKLRTLLADNDIPQAEWGAAIIQPNGKPLSSSAQTQILRWNIWPKKTSAEHIKKETYLFLLSKGGEPGETMDEIWEEETDNTKRQSHPIKKARGATNTAGFSKKANGLEDNIHLMDLPEATMLSQKAKQHFKCFTDPFRNDVTNPDDVFLSKEQKYIREAMRHAAKHAGFLAVIGESGAGKSTLRRDLIDYIRRDNEKIVIIQPLTVDKGRLTAGAICDSIIADMSYQDNPSYPRSLEAKARKVKQLLTDSSRVGNAHVLLIEEAHDLSIPTLKQLKRFWEFEDGHTRLLGIVLVGQPELKQKLDERINPQAREVIRRIEVAELLPLNKDLEAYLNLKFNKINVNVDDVIDIDAYDAIRQRLTFKQRQQGQPIDMTYPLVVNNVITKAMNQAAELGEALILAELIAEV